MERLGELVGVVKRALVLRAVLRHAAEGAVLGAVACLVTRLFVPWLPRWPHAVLLGSGPFVLGGALGLWRVFRTRPSDDDVVLYLDRRLDADAAIVTAFELAREADGPPASLLAEVDERLRRAGTRFVRPPVLRGTPWGLGFAALAWGAALLVPVPPARGGPPGSEVVRVQDAEVLRAIERLPERVVDPSRRREFERAAERARELRRDLAEGIEQREALDRIAALREQLAGVRPEETATERRARDAAVEALADEPEMQRALSERDPELFDRAVERAAARREAADRDRARAALRAAARAAAEAGDFGLERALLRRDRLLEARVRQAELVRELAEAMPELRADGVRRALERLSRDGDGSELTRELVDAMREAWSRLSADERRRLAEAMQHVQAAENDAASVSREGDEASAGAPDADTLEAQLRQALQNLDRLQAQIGRTGGGPQGTPVPAPSRLPAAPGQGGGQGQGQGQGQGVGQAQGQGQGQGQGGGSARGQGQGRGHQGQGGGRGPQGGDPGGGAGGNGSRDGPATEGPETDRATRTLQGRDGVLARVRPLVDPGAAPANRTYVWVDPAGTPLPRGVGAADPTGQPALGEPGAIERTPVPEEYREQVRRFFGGL
jgi:hypothetical protein